MIDRELRTRLSQDLRRLVTGRMTNDDFDNAYYDQYANSTDAAVAKTAEFGYCLYDSDLLLPYRLTGKRAVAKRERRTVARCILFLRTDRKYNWPQWPHSMGRLRVLCWLSVFGQSVGLISIATLAIVIPFMFSMPIAFNWPVVAIWPISAFGLACFIFSMWYRRSTAADQFRNRTPEWRAWLEAGDFDVWPFSRREDFYQTRQAAYLLGATSPTRTAD